jgi:hypothetical protein
MKQYICLVRQTATCRLHRESFIWTLGGKSEQVGTMDPEALAKQLLLELIKAGKA